MILQLILLANYHLDKLKGDRGGIPRAFKCERTVCTLFALLLEERFNNDMARLISQLPDGVGDPLSETLNIGDATDDNKCELIWQEISEDMKKLEPERYIKRCFMLNLIGG